MKVLKWCEFVTGIAMLVACAGLVMMGFFGTSFYKVPIVEAQVAAALGAPTDVIEIGDVTVRVQCYDHTYVATTDIFTNQVGVAGGDVAVAAARGCSNKTPVYAGNVTNGRGTILAHLYCKGSTLIAVTPIFTNQIGVIGGNVSLTPHSDYCR